MHPTEKPRHPFTSLTHYALALTLVCGLAKVALPAGAAPQQASIQTQSETHAATLAAQAFDLRDVRLLDGPFLEAQKRNAHYILRFNMDGLLYWFRKNNGMPAPGKPYGEWKPTDYVQQGHFQGRYLSGCALMYRSTGDVRFKERGDALVAGLAHCQKPNGFLATFPESVILAMAGLEKGPDTRYLPQPWYCLHKLYAGLLDMYVLAGNQQALEALERAADWIQSVMDRIDDAKMQKMLDMEHGGMNEVLANLYAVTGKLQYLKLARRFCHRAVMDPFLRGEDPLEKLHANTQIPKFVGEERLYELTGEPQQHTIAQGFWERVVRERSYVTGGNSEKEHFSPKAMLSQYLGTANTETCNTYNMLKLTRLLFVAQPRSEYFDYFERAQLNHILSSQHPETGMVMYFHSLQSGNPKGTYSGEWGSMACCHGSAMESHAKYADSIYWHDQQGCLWVNLFIASELNWRVKGVTLRQETRFPEEGRTRLTFTCAQPTKLSVRLRRPFWAGEGFAVNVNGERQAVSAKAGDEGYLELNRVWKSGDSVEITMPMTFRLEGFHDNPRRVAVMYGPLVMSAATELGNRFSVIRGGAQPALAQFRFSERICG